MIIFQIPRDAAKSVPDIVREAAKSPLGILALIVLLLSFLAYIFFRKAREKTRIGIFTLMFLGALAFGGAVMKTVTASDHSDRDLFREEWLKARSDTPSLTLNQDAAASNSTSNMLGITLWVLRSPVFSDPDQSRILTHEGQGYTPIRGALDTPLRVGQRIRFGIESLHSGYLYVIDRERYSTGELGDPIMIFPTERIRGGDNHVGPGLEVELPDQHDDPPFLTITRTRQDLIGEILTFVVADKPLAVSIGPNAVALPRQLIQQWEDTWTSEITRHESDKDLGQLYTKAERDAGWDQNRRLTHTAPVPHTLFNVKRAQEYPLLVKLSLNIAN